MVYYIEAVGADMLKIGFTDRDPEERLKELQTGNPHKLRLVAYRDGDTDDEQREHKRWASQRTSGEWFCIDNRLRWYLNWLEFGLPEVIERLKRMYDTDVYLESLVDALEVRADESDELATMADEYRIEMLHAADRLALRVSSLEGFHKAREMFVTDRNRFADCRV